MPNSLLAELVLALHLGVILFVVGGQGMILAGWRWGWCWTRNPWFRTAHVGAILFIVVQSWLGQRCPLTNLEHHLRLQAGERGYQRSFISEWVGRLVYYTAPDWVFGLAYSLFALLVIATLYAYPPRRS